MIKRNLYSLVLLALIFSSSFGADVLWTNLSDNNSWFEPQNWSSEQVPQNTTDIRIQVFPPKVAPVVESGQSAHCRAFKLRDGDIVIDSGTLNVNYWGGAGSWGGVNASLTLAGNAILNVVDRFYIGYSQRGLLRVKDNSQAFFNSELVIAKSDNITPATGHLQLDSGTVRTAGIQVDNDGVNSKGTVDIVNGTLIVDANVVTDIQNYVDADIITAYWNHPQAYLEVNCVNDVTTVTASIPSQFVSASEPDPADHSVDVDRNYTLSWSASELASYHDLYLGTDFNEVNDADITSYCYQGRYDINSLAPGKLGVGQNYFWRVDEVKNDVTWKGNVWNFKTPVYAPADFNMDFIVNFDDYAEFVEAWLSVPGEFSFDDIYDLHDDNNINLPDLGEMTGDWLVRNPVEIEITVNSSQVKHKVSDYIIGMNMSYWRDSDLRWQNGVIADRLADVNTAILRWPGGGEVAGYHWSTCPGTPKWKDEWETDPNSELYFEDHHECQNPEFMDVNEFLYWCYDVIGAEAAIGINYESGWRYDRLQDSVDEAVELVEHIKNLGYDVKYYYLGNETYGGFISPEDYADVINIFASAMKSVDPDINLMPNMPSETSQPWVIDRYRGILNGADPNIDQMDTHWYWARLHTTWERWLDQIPLRNDFHSYVGPSYTDEITNWYDDIHGLGYDANLCVMEWSAGIPDEETWQEDSLSAFQCALVGSEMFLHFMAGDIFMTAYYPSTFAPSTPRNPNRTIIDSYTYEPRPMYYALKLFANAPGNDLVSCDSSRADAPTVAVVNNDDSRVWIYVLNKSHQVRVTKLNLSNGNYSDIDAISLVSLTDEYGDLSEYEEPNFNTTNDRILVALPAYSLTMITVSY